MGIETQCEPGTTPGYNGCTCSCHRMAGVAHCVPCCYPSNEDLKAAMDKAKQTCDELDEARKVTWQQLHEPFTI